MKKLPNMTDTARALVDEIMVTLGKKTKVLFTNELYTEYQPPYILNYGDVMEVARKLKLK